MTVLCMWQRLALRHRIRCRAPLICLLACWIAGGALAQTTELVSVKQEDQLFLMMPKFLTTSQFLDSGDIRISSEVQQGVVRYRATQGETVAYSNWFNQSQETPWVVYLPESGKFQEVSNRIVVTIKDASQLDALAEDIGVQRAKHYKTTGYAVLWLDRKDNPAQVALRLKADSRVSSAEIQLKAPRHFPW